MEIKMGEKVKNPLQSGGECDIINHGHAESGVLWLHGQAVKTSPFHGGNTGSIPVGVTDCKADTQLSIKRAYSPMWLNWQSS